MAAGRVRSDVIFGHVGDPGWAWAAAGLLVALALMEREKPWLVLDTWLALAALTGAFAALSERGLHAQ